MFTASNTTEDGDDETPSKPSLVPRLKRLLLAAAMRLRRLGRPQDEASGADEAAAHAGGETNGEAALNPATPSPWRRLLPFGAALLAGAAAGGCLVYWLSARIDSRQAAELLERQAEADRLRGLVAGYDKLMLQFKKQLEAERLRRLELENRLAAAQAELARRSAMASPPGAGGPSASAAAQEAGKGGNCTLRAGAIGGALKDCLAAFNGR